MLAASFYPLLYFPLHVSLCHLCVLFLLLSSLSPPNKHLCCPLLPNFPLPLLFQNSSGWSLSFGGRGEDGATGPVSFVSLQYNPPQPPQAQQPEHRHSWSSLEKLLKVMVVIRQRSAHSYAHKSTWVYHIHLHV